MQNHNKSANFVIIKIYYFSEINISEKVIYARRPDVKDVGYSVDNGEPIDATTANVSKTVRAA